MPKVKTPPVFDPRDTKPGVSRYGNRYTFAKKLAIFGDVKAGITYEEIAKSHMVSTATVSNIVRDPLINEAISHPIVEQRKKHFANILYFVSDMCFSSIEPEEIKKMNPLQRGTLGAICIDKARIIEGLSTENLSIRGMMGSFSTDFEALKERKEKLLEAANEC